MKPAPYPIRWAIVAALVVNLSGAGFVVSPAAGCVATQAADAVRHSPSECCCRDHCLCGPRCGAPDAPTQGDEQPSSRADGQRAPWGPFMLAVDALSTGLLRESLRPAIADWSSAEIAPLQTLFDQHTCLRA